MTNGSSTAGRPIVYPAGSGTYNRDWWPNRLRLDVLRQHSSLSGVLSKLEAIEVEFNTVQRGGKKASLADDHPPEGQRWRQFYVQAMAAGRLGDRSTETRKLA